MPKQLNYENNGKYDGTLAIGFLVADTPSFIDEHEKQIVSTIAQSIGLLKEIQQLNERLAINVGVLKIGKHAKKLDWISKGFMPVEQVAISTLQTTLVGSILEDKDIGVSGFGALNDLLSIDLIPEIMLSGAFPPVDFSFVLLSGEASSSDWRSGLSSIEKNEYFNRATKISVTFEEPASDFARSFSVDEPVSPLALPGELLKLFPQENEIQHPMLSWAANEGLALTEPVILQRCEIMTCEPEHAADPVALLCPYNEQIFACAVNDESQIGLLKLNFSIPNGSSRSFPYSDEDKVSVSAQEFRSVFSTHFSLTSTVSNGKIIIQNHSESGVCFGCHERFDHRWFSLMVRDELKSATGKTIISIKPAKDPWDSDDEWS